ncbi:MAG: YidC/Oxa1 family membrane protein insertase [Thermomicrobiales bacterium]
MLVHLFGFDIDLTLVLAWWSPPGWDPFVNLFEESLDFLARNLSSAGLAIVAFTIIVKTILLPLTVKALRSSKAMQDLQPRIKELQKKHGKDRQRLSQETMQLYAQHGVNPMAGCLPMLLQIPIFLALYNAINHLSGGNGGASEFWAEGFLWLDSLDEADPYKILPILAGVFQFVQTKMMRPANQGPITDPQQRMMNQMMNFMPLMVVIFGWTFASGPVIYWATQSIYSVIQQWFITGWGSLNDWIPRLPELPEHRRLGYRPPRPVDDVVVVSGDGRPVPQGRAMRWMQSRMEKAQEQAEARRATAQGRAPVKGTRPATASNSASEAASGVETDGVEETVSTSTRSSSYEARVAGAKKKPAGAGRSASTYQHQVDTTTSQANGLPARARAQRKRKSQSRTQPTNGRPTNGTPRGPVVPRKSRPGKKRE